MSNAAKRRFGTLLLVLSAGAVGCGPSQAELDAERAKVSELSGQLQEAERQRQALDARLLELQALNEDMANRLRALGQNLEAERSSLEETRRALEELRDREKQAQARLQTFRNLLEKFRAMIESGKLRVRVVRNRMVVELPESILFDSGKANLKNEGKGTLAEVASVLGSIKDRQFQIAGHTDNVPIRTSRFPSNWELSTARAVEVAQYLIAQGVPANRLSAAGYAETEPVTENDSTEGRAQNRRIEIVLVPNLDELPDLSSLADITKN